ncbi:MAG: hypothetical protein QG588_1234, partial [Candidatus Poribacteria bacterium]|nr:hypothetical protein [Candidatus Poribacteria bacterium]
TSGVVGMGLSYLASIAISKSGLLYVADSGNQCIKVFRLAKGEVVTPQEKQHATWGMVKQTELYQNYPNPFNPETWIPYQLGEDADVTIKIYNSTGQLVRKLELGQKPAGSYLDKNKAVHWDGKNSHGDKVASGIYFYQFESENYSALRKFVVIE